MKKMVVSLFALSLMTTQAFSQSDRGGGSEGPGNNGIVSPCIEVSRFEKLNPKKIIRKRQVTARRAISLGAGLVIIAATGGAGTPILLWIAGSTAFEVGVSDTGKIRAARVLGYTSLNQVYFDYKNNDKNFLDDMNRVSGLENYAIDLDQQVKAAKLDSTFEEFSEKVNNRRMENGQLPLNEDQIFKRVKDFNQVGLACKGFQGKEKWIAGLINEKRLVKEIAKDKQ